MPTFAFYCLLCALGAAPPATTATTTTTAAPAPAPAWDLQNFLAQQGDAVGEYLQRQKQKVQEIVTSGYAGAVHVKESLDEFVAERQRAVADEVNRYVEELSFSPGSRAARPDERLARPDAALSVPALALRLGRACETHALASQGYVLQLHRLPPARASARAPVVLLQHGLFASSADWLLAGERALALALHDAGYDVWMPNVRGNRYSREHLELRTDSRAYWNFSWEEMAERDMPAVIDYVLALRGPGVPVAYVGHSMGTTILLAMLAARPEYNAKLAGAFLLAPVAFTAGVRGPLRALAPIASNVAYMQSLYGSREFVPQGSSISGLAEACREDGGLLEACRSAIFSICGEDEEQLDSAVLPAFLAHLGSGTSWKTVVHFAQEIQAGGRFQRFDYGEARNRRLYGGAAPAAYELARVTLPVTLFWARNDPLSAEADVRALAAALGGRAALREVAHARFNHLDYLWARDAPALLHAPLLAAVAALFRNATSA